MESVFALPWPETDLEAAKEESLEIPVQVNGKVRARLLASPEWTAEALREAALSDANVKKYTDGKMVSKVVVVPGRMVNIAVTGDAPAQQ